MSKVTRKRILIGLAAVVFVPWIGLAVLYWLYAGPSVNTFVSGLQLGPVLAAGQAREMLRPERNFAGLEHPQAVAMLRRAFGRGVTPSDGRLLCDLIVEKGYRRALDIGTARGYSGLWFGLAMKKTGGKMITIEIDPAIAGEARDNFRRAGLADVIDSRINDALLEIPAIPGEPGGAITAHNAYGFQSTQPEFLKAIENDPKLETKIVRTASGGISLTFKKSQ